MRIDSITRAVPVLLLSVAIAGCSDDNGDSPTDLPPSLEGSWIATSFVVDGIDAIDLGMGMSVFFQANGEYSILTTNDMLDMCDEGMTTCEVVGDYTATSTTLTFDPQEDPSVFTYTITGNIMTMTGALDGMPVVATWERG